MLSDANEYRPPEPWVTMQQLADHLSMTCRWIESQQQLGLPNPHTGYTTATASPRSRPGYTTATTHPRETPDPPRTCGLQVALASSRLFAFMRSRSHLFAENCHIGATGSSWLFNAVFRTPATGLQRTNRVAAELNPDSDHPYAMPNVRTGSCRADKTNSGAIFVRTLICTSRRSL